MHKASVLLPCFNGARWIREAIDSVLIQTYENFELIIIDDGSTDNTKQVIAPYRRDRRVRYIYQRNRGFTGAINRGIKESKGHVVGFIGQDDLWASRKLDLQLKFLDEHKNVSLVHSSYELIDFEGHVKGLIRARIPNSSSRREVVERLFMRNFIGWETVLVKKDCFDRVGLLDKRMVSFSDHDMWLRVLGSYNFGYLDEPLVKKRQHALQLSRVRIETSLRDEFLMVSKAVRHYSFLRRLMQRKFASLYYALGIAKLLRGDTKKAKQELAKSVKCHPWGIKAAVVSIMPTLYVVVSDYCSKTSPRIPAGLR